MGIRTSLVPSIPSAHMICPPRLDRRHAPNSQKHMASASASLLHSSSHPILILILILSVPKTDVRVVAKYLREWMDATSGALTSSGTIRYDTIRYRCCCHTSCRQLLCRSRSCRTWGVVYTVLSHPVVSRRSQMGPRKNPCTMPKDMNNEREKNKRFRQTASQTPSNAARWIVG
ncbi:hypothetical protein K491DRAFT_104435 [Lophiostoma macrostomum CBS 122681]|uniref:Uncharacterized protein n=1 Tax=Lophiostoma macrostomum CBS 122681 TaxID=1314788 RepID=A0A6A6STQ9_9PLEO|nr:hypothetical protein K491DRAFT_104435 [Lophiostoma macrostomum CBS 122681]